MGTRNACTDADIHACMHAAESKGRHTLATQSAGMCVIDGGQCMGLDVFEVPQVEVFYQSAVWVILDDGTQRCWCTEQCRHLRHPRPMRHCHCHLNTIVYSPL